MARWGGLAAAVLTLVAGVVFVRAFVVTVSEAPLEDGAVVVLGGGSDERFAVAVELLPSPSETRPLVLSYPMPDERAAVGGCQGPEVRCVRPEPASTWGEAQQIARLARDAGWPGVTVVTSDYHTARTRSLFRRCVDVPVRVVGAESSPRGRVSLRRAVSEAVATVYSAIAYRDC